MLQGILATCRPGFEKECAAELSHRAAQAGFSGYPQAKPDEGFCIFYLSSPASEKIFAIFDWKSLIFVRSLIFLPQPVLTVPGEDRVTPLLETLKAWPKALQRFSAFSVESSDATEGRELSPFCRSFSKPLKGALQKLGFAADHWDEPVQCTDDERCLHVFFVDYTRVFIGLSMRKFNTPWPRGIVRLRFPSDAPSRSTLKLEEAFLSFLNADERASSLAPSRRAVDLGASPGGWSYQFVRRGIRTAAVDNGPMDARLLESGLVEHLRVDGFKFVPPRPVDWMVCDMVERPRRVAELVLKWWTQMHAKRMIVNLKLPMKKRWQEVSEIKTLMTDELQRLERPFDLSIKHLYHDREEVTLYLGPNSST